METLTVTPCEIEYENPIETSIHKTYSNINGNGKPSIKKEKFGNLKCHKHMKQIMDKFNK